MNYIVFDLEWNQPISQKVMVTDPVYLTGEIIEIGAVKLNDAFETVDELRLYIVPQFYTDMDQRITSLTNIHLNYLKKNGVPFPDAMKQFAQWCGDEYSYMTWSKSDLPMLVDNMILHGMDISDLPVAYDIQRMFDWEIMRTDRQYSLDDAIEILGEKGDVAHDALHDARNTVKVCNHLDLDVYLEEYASHVFAEVPAGKTYGSRDDLLFSEEMSSFRCPWCGEVVTCDGWLPLNGHRYMGRGVCPDGDDCLIIMNCYLCGPGAYRGSRLIYEMNEDLWQFYQDQLEFQPLITDSQVAQ